jgi:hypothetical protein
MTWRREDYGYAAATLAAVVFLAYLIAGNFGIVPSPLSIGRGDELPEAEIAVLASSQTLTRPVPVAQIAPAPAPKAPKDATPTAKPLPAPPTVAISTKSGTQVSVQNPGSINGTATGPAGVLKVEVSFAPSSGDPATVLSTLTCNAGKHACGWVAKIPSLAGGFRVTATVTDIFGRTSTSKPIDIMVLNPGNVIGGVTSTVDTVVQNAPQTIEQLAGVVNNLVGLLGL